MSQETFREIPDSPGYYATSDGEIIGRRGKLIKLTVGTNGRLGVRVWYKGSWKRREVHVMVCVAFHGPRPDGKVASHLDGNMLNNRPDNLLWETYRENLARRAEHGTDDKGLRNSRSVLTIEAIREIRNSVANETHQSIANRLGVSRTTISRVVNGLRYKEVE